MTIPYNSQDTSFYLNLSYHVTNAQFVTVQKEQWENICYYLVTCAGKQFDVQVEQPIEDGIECCTVGISYLGRHMFAGNIREVSNFFDIVGRTLSVLA